MVDGWSLKPLRLQLHPFLQVLLGSSSLPVRFGPPRDSSGYDSMGSAVLVYIWAPGIDYIGALDGGGGGSCHMSILGKVHVTCH